MNLVEYLSHKAALSESAAKSAAISFGYADTQMPHEQRQVEALEAVAALDRNTHDGVLAMLFALDSIAADFDSGHARVVAAEAAGLTRNKI